MSLKDALSKRPQIAPEVAPNQPQPLPSLNNHIQPYGNPSRPVSNSDLEKRAFATKQAERVVTIGESVVLKGDISDCDRAEISGQFDGTIVASSIQISEGGSVKGAIECEELSIAGSVDGKVTSTKTLEIKATGKLTGEILYEEFLVTAGGEISGTMEKNHPTTPGVVSG